MYTKPVYLSKINQVAFLTIVIQVFDTAAEFAARGEFSSSSILIFGSAVATILLRTLEKDHVNLDV